MIFSQWLTSKCPEHTQSPHSETNADLGIHSETSTVSTYSVNRTSGYFERMQNFTYSTSSPGPNAARQDASHPHGVTVDPTGQYILVPDLGADVVRIYHINPMNGLLRPVDPLIASPASGPRHAVFWTPEGSASLDSNVYFYLVHELSNTLTGYRVSYKKHGMAFSQIFEGGTYGNRTAPPGSKVAEISITVCYIAVTSLIHDVVRFLTRIECFSLETTISLSAIALTIPLAGRMIPLPYFLALILTDNISIMSNLSASFQRMVHLFEALILVLPPT